MNNEQKKTERATFGMGCFWGSEEVFRKTPGVVETAVGFMGGSVEHPSYERVCRGDTGHAEVVEVVFDPTQISYEQLLDLFWQNHDPTQKNRQGPDVGTQYRSAIFFRTAEQKRLAEASKQKRSESKMYATPIVTEVVEAGTFWRAEDYHQRYFEKRGGGVCHI